MTAGGLTEATVREWCAANNMVLVSRTFWVAAANALRKAAGHALADEPGMTDAEAWEYVRERAAGS